MKLPCLWEFGGQKLARDHILKAKEAAFLYDKNGHLSKQIEADPITHLCWGHLAELHKIILYTRQFNNNPELGFLINRLITIKVPLFQSTGTFFLRCMEVLKRAREGLRHWSEPGKDSHHWSEKVTALSK